MILYKAPLNRLEFFFKESCFLFFIVKMPSSSDKTATTAATGLVVASCISSSFSSSSFVAFDGSFQQVLPAFNHGEKATDWIWNRYTRMAFRCLNDFRTEISATQVPCKVRTKLIQEKRQTACDNVQNRLNQLTALLVQAEPYKLNSDKL